MKRSILISVIFIVTIFIIIQTIRFNYQGRNVNDFKFTNINNKELTLKNVFNENDDKLILYILPECESCIVKLNELIRLNDYSKTQIIIISVGLKNFDFKNFYKNKLSNKRILFLIDKNNTFYRDFGLGFTEEFPTLIKYNMKTKMFNKI
jgi:hypothetical protein